MARTIKHDEHAVKRNDILDAAQKLIYAKGYEEMAIQDILDDLRMSKGAFYHYYGSKQALLEALIERSYQELDRLLRPIADDPKRNALAKLNEVFSVSGRWKTARKDYLLVVIRGWYADENALFRHKVTATMIKRVTPMLAEIVQQGVREGVFTTPYPDEAAEFLYSSMVTGFGDAFAELILGSESRERPLSKDERLRRGLTLTAAYTDAMERVLGAPKGSIELMDAKTIKQWLATPLPAPQENGHVAVLSDGKKPR
jgi:AcrR family transcriptional regulator